MAQLPTLTDIAKAVSEHLAESGLGVNEAADLAGIARTTFKRHLSDGAFGSHEIVKIAGALGTTPSAIYARAESVAA